MGNLLSPFHRPRSRTNVRSNKLSRYLHGKCGRRHHIYIRRGGGGEEEKEYLQNVALAAAEIVGGNAKVDDRFFSLRYVYRAAGVLLLLLVLVVRSYNSLNRCYTNYGTVEVEASAECKKLQLK